MSSGIPTAKYTNPDLSRKKTEMTPGEFDARQPQIEAFGGQFKPDDNNSFIKDGDEADKRMADMVNTVLEATPAVLARRAAEKQRAAARGVLTDGTETEVEKE